MKPTESPAIHKTRACSDETISFLSHQAPPLRYYEVTDGRRRNFNNRGKNGAGADQSLAERSRTLLNPSFPRAGR